jgi:hypothetical protein
MIGTEAFAYTGAVLLGIATIPQALILLRTRNVGGFGWAFSVFNFIGLGFLAARSLAIQEWAFLGINLLTTSFWGMVVGMKVIHLVERLGRGRAGLTETPVA